MRKRSIFIVDSDEPHRKQITMRLKGSPSFAVVGSCSNVEEAASLIHKFEPHLILMDADLQEGSGFRVVAECSYFPAVIFTSKSDNHALKAFEHDAIDYLLKPISPGRLQVALEKYLRSDSTIGFREHSYPGNKIKTNHRILVENGRRHKCISLDQITHFKADKDYTRIYTLDNKTYLSNSGISIIEEKLDPQRFLKVHRSYIVNTEHILGCYRDISKLFLSLPNDHEVNVGRTFLPAIRNMIF